MEVNFITYTKIRIRYFQNKLKQLLAPNRRRVFRLDENRVFKDLLSEDASAGDEFAAHLAWTSGRLYNWAKGKTDPESIHPWVCLYV